MDLHGTPGVGSAVDDEEKVVQPTVIVLDELILHSHDQVDVVLLGPPVVMKGGGIGSIGVLEAVVDALDSVGSCGVAALETDVVFEDGTIMPGRYILETCEFLANDVDDTFDELQNELAIAACCDIPGKCATTSASSENHPRRRFSARRKIIEHACDLQRAKDRLAHCMEQFERSSDDDEQQPPQQQYSNDEDDSEEPQHDDAEDDDDLIENDDEWLAKVLTYTPGGNSRATKIHQQQSDAEVGGDVSVQNHPRQSDVQGDGNVSALNDLGNKALAAAAVAADAAAALAAQLLKGTLLDAGLKAAKEEVKLAERRLELARQTAKEPSKPLTDGTETAKEAPTGAEPVPDDDAEQAGNDNDQGLPSIMTVTGLWRTLDVNFKKNKKGRVVKKGGDIMVQCSSTTTGKGRMLLGTQNKNKSTWNWCFVNEYFWMLGGETVYRKLFY